MPPRASVVLLVASAAGASVACTFPQYELTPPTVDSATPPDDTSERDEGIDGASDAGTDVRLDTPNGVDAPDADAHDGDAAVCPPTGCPPLSCLDAKAQQPSAPDGVYEIDIDGPLRSEKPFPVYCDMTTDGGGWTMVFKITAGVVTTPDAGGLWTRGTPVNESDINVINLLRSNPYANRLIGKYWTGVSGAYGPTTVRVNLLRKGVIDAYFKFKNGGATNTDWFAPANLAGSSYMDVNPQTTFNVFSIPAPSFARSWHINSVYGGCNIDGGWLVVSSNPSACPWESVGAAPHILVAAPPKVATWQDAGGKGPSTSVIAADVLAVMVR